MTTTHWQGHICRSPCLQGELQERTPKASHCCKSCAQMPGGHVADPAPCTLQQTGSLDTGKGWGTSLHSIWTCGEAYGFARRERAPICSPSWARLAHSQPPHTFGCFINQPLPTIPVRWLIHVWLMHTFACSLERTPGTGGEEGKRLNWSGGGAAEGRGGHSSLLLSQHYL